MVEFKIDLPVDIGALKALVEQRDSRIEYLEGQLRLMLSQRFSPSSETAGTELQLGLFNEAELEAESEPVDDDSSSPVSAHCRARPGQKPLR